MNPTPSETGNGGDEGGGHQLVVLHPHLDSGEDSVVLLGQISQHGHVQLPHHKAVLELLSVNGRTR